jgi:hypothetical protein
LLTYPQSGSHCASGHRVPRNRRRNAAFATLPLSPSPGRRGRHHYRRPGEEVTAIVVVPGRSKRLLSPSPWEKRQPPLSPTAPRRRGRRHPHRLRLEKSIGTLGSDSKDSQTNKRQDRDQIYVHSQGLDAGMRLHRSSALTSPTLPASTCSSSSRSCVVTINIG